MDSRGYFRGLEASGEARLLFRIARRKPRAVQHGPGPEIESRTRRQTAQLPRLSVCGSGWTGVRKCVAGIFIRGCGANGRIKVKTAGRSAPHDFPALTSYLLLTTLPGPLSLPVGRG